MRVPILFAAALIPLALLDAAPVPKDFGDREEVFQWQGKKRVRIVRTQIIGGEKLEFVKVPKGSFRMGSPEADRDARKDEKPDHEVTFTKPRWVGKYAVTKGQFAAFVTATKYRPQSEKDGGLGFERMEARREGVQYTWRNTGWEQTNRHPVVNVSWNDATAFCAWASKEGKATVRLLSEAEYEYANRGGTTTRYFTGDDAASLKGYANVSDKSWAAAWGRTTDGFDDGEPFTAAVGRYDPNGFGLHDMTGNAWCLCADWYDETAYEERKGGVTDPEPHAGGKREERSVRGGSWLCDHAGCRAASRESRAESFCGYGVGFRVALASD